MRALSLLFVVLALVPLLGLANASYNVTNVRVSMYLNQNTSAQVNETIQVAISNQSVAQYQANRLALNFTLGQWQKLIGSQLQEHIINPKSGIYNFILLPGPVVQSGTNYRVDIVLSYDVSNVTTVNQTSPRVFVYTLKSGIFNFQHGASGEVLSQNTTFNITIPTGSRIKTVYPVPDSPPYGVTNNYANVTSVAWYYGEPLSNFNFVFVVNQSIRDEVGAFFSKIYQTLGLYSYLIIAAIIVLFVLYVYYRASK